MGLKTWVANIATKVALEAIKQDDDRRRKAEIFSWAERTGMDLITAQEQDILSNRVLLTKAIKWKDYFNPTTYSWMNVFLIGASDPLCKKIDKMILELKLEVAKEDLEIAKKALNGRT